MGLSSAEGNCHNNNNSINDHLASSSVSKSSSFSSYSSSITGSSSPSGFSPSSPIQNQTMTGNSSLEEVWDDLNLASIHDHSSNNRGSNSSTHHHALHGMMFQDFLTRVPSKETPSKRVSSSRETCSGTVGGGTNFLNSLGSPPGVMLSLTSGSDDHHFQYLESNSATMPMRPIPQMQSHGSGGTLTFDHALGGYSSSFPSFCKKRVHDQNGDVSGGDRRHKRMIKNRESAARSRARKQAYTTELECEVTRLVEENAKLRRQQERFLAATPTSQLPKRPTLYRTLTAPF